MTGKKELGVVVFGKVRHDQDSPGWFFSTAPRYGIYFEKKLIWLDDSHEIERIDV